MTATADAATYSIDEAAEIAGVSYWTMRRSIKEGRAPAVQVSARIWRVPKKRFHEWLAGDADAGVESDARRH